jgi:hypothetical protein
VPPSTPAKSCQALRAADFSFTRGSFRYNTNHFPLQDFYLVQAEQRSDGSYATAIWEKIFEDHADQKAAECPMARSKFMRKWRRRYDTAEPSSPHHEGDHPLLLTARGRWMSLDALPYPKAPTVREAVGDGSIPDPPITSCDQLHRASSAFC